LSLILSGTDGLSDVDGSASTPAIRGTDTNTGIFFPAADTIAFAEGGAEVARFDSSGNLGIGTTSITNNKLLVKGAHVSGGAVVGLQTDQATTGSPIYLGFFNSSNTRIGYVGCDTATNMQLVTAENVPMTLGTNNTERMRLDNSGGVFIGCTTTPTSSISGIRLSNPSTYGQSVFGTGSGTGVATVMAFVNGNGQVGRIDTSGSNAVYVTTSDYRLKENVAPMVGSLTKVTQLKPCTYTWKADGSDGQGFIAHELAEVFPEAVVGDKDAVEEDGSIKPQGIDTSFLVATLTAAIQELKAELDSVKAELATLKA
jgi:hypothetical protein